jgi:peptidoglycan/LPS O-acetylase OafA/YrhL
VPRLAVLDGYRAVAALLVVTTHVSFSTGFVLNLPLGAVFSRFDIGVTIFFLLSGFLLYRPWARAGLTGSTRPELSAYFKRRFFRIIPAYWIVVVTVLLVLPTAALSLETVLTNLSLTQFYVSGAQVEGLTQMWSVAVEVSFYLVLPLVGWLALRKSAGSGASARRQLQVLTLMWIIGAGFSALRTVGPLGGELGTGFWVIGFLDWFAVGMAVGLAYELLSLPDPPRWARRLQSLANETATCLILAAALFVMAATPLA